jgi:two-component system sensor kinase
MLRHLPSWEKRDSTTLAAFFVILGIFILYVISNLAQNTTHGQNIISAYFALCTFSGTCSAVLSATFIYLLRNVTGGTPFRKIFGMLAILMAICGFGFFARAFSGETDPWYTVNILPFVAAVFALSAFIVLKSVPEIVEFLGRLKRAETKVEILNTTNRDLESFASNLTHDLRCPLRAIAGYSTVLKEDYGNVLDEEGKNTINKIHKNVDKMSALIDGILHFARCSHQRMAYESVDLNNIVYSVFDTLKQNIHGRKVNLDMLDLHPIKGDPLLLKQIFMNLIGNAIKFTRDRNEAVIHIGSMEEENNITYYVKDNGIGFEQQYAEKIFKAFQRLHTDAQYEGTGIGLSIVESLVHRHGGTIKVEGNPGKGAAFYVIFPKKRAAA